MRLLLIGSMAMHLAGGCDFTALLEEAEAVRAGTEQEDLKPVRKAAETLRKRAAACPGNFRLESRIADVSLRLKMPREAERFGRLADEHATAAFGAESLERAVSIETLAQALSAQNRFLEAEPLVRDALRIVEAKGGQTSYFRASLLNTLASLHTGLNDPEGAQRQLEKAWAILENRPGDPLRAVVRHNLGAAALRQGRTQEARMYLDMALREAESLPPSLRRQMESATTIKAFR